MDKLKEMLRKEIIGMLATLDDENLKIEADRFCDIANCAELIGTMINGCEEINWDEGL